jgi:hypothetical protein
VLTGTLLRCQFMDDQKGIFRWNDFSDFGDYFVKKVRGLRHGGASADGALGRRCTPHRV